jgi:hypothetical protein
MSPSPTTTTSSVRRKTNRDRVNEEGTIELVLYSEVVLPSLPSIRNVEQQVELDKVSQEGVGRASEDGADGQGAAEDMTSSLAGLAIDDQDTEDGVDGHRLDPGQSDRDSEGVKADASHRIVWARYLNVKGELQECHIEAM